MSFTNQNPFEVTEELRKGFTRGKRRFQCSMCGHEFAVGDVAKWVYANYADSPVRCGNFFVCQTHDLPNVMELAAESYNNAKKLAKQWGIYGPDWQND